MTEVKKGQHGEPWRVDEDGVLCDPEGPLSECWCDVQEERNQRAADCVNVLDGWDVDEAREILSCASAVKHADNDRAHALEKIVYWRNEWTVAV